MKRTPLKRKTPLRKVNPDRAKKDREYKKVREVYLRENPVCARCRGCPAVEIHHICSGGSRAKSLANTETWLGLCHFCHGYLQSSPIKTQVRDKLDFVLATINRLRGRAENAITLEELV